jgi:hypothetical protein
MILWLTMLFRIAVYPAVMRVFPPAQPAENPKLVAAVMVGALALAAASFPVKSRFFAQAREAANPRLKRQGMIVAIVLCEAAALMGLAAWFVTASPRCYCPIAAGFVGVLFHYPAREA